MKHYAEITTVICDVSDTTTNVLITK